MNVVEHFFISWCIANARSDLTARDRFLITAAGVAPDLDGLGMLVEIPTRDTAHPLLWWTDYHHVITHNVAAAAVIAGIVAIFATTRIAAVLLALLSFHAHILGDVIGARGPDGYQWPIPYFLPFSRTPELTWSGQWALNAWPNMVITACALLLTFILATRRGYSPLEMFSKRGDAVFVATLRARFSARSA